jgi:hypothetical protein
LNPAYYFNGVRNIMREPITFANGDPGATLDSAVELFDPPMCCSTGICGPTVDQTLVDVNQMVLELQAAGIHVARYQMTSQPQALLNNADVMRLVREHEMAALPITVVRGRLLATGKYPTLSEIKSALDGAAT